MRQFYLRCTWPLVIHRRNFGVPPACWRILLAVRSSAPRGFHRVAKRGRRRGGSEPARFVWDQEVTDWSGFRRKDLSQSGRLALSVK